MRNTNSSKVGHTHDDRYYTEAEVDNKFISGYQTKSESFTDKYIAKGTWTYIGPKDIAITPGLWLITYTVRVSATSSAIKCSIRSTIDNKSCQSIVTDTKDLIMSMELTELAQVTNAIWGLYPQFYTPIEYTFREIVVKVSAVKLR